MMIKKGSRLRLKRDSDINATVILVLNEDIVVMVDGYAASSTYTLNELVREWEVANEEPVVPPQAHPGAQA